MLYNDFIIVNLLECFVFFGKKLVLDFIKEFGIFLIL